MVTGASQLLSRYLSTIPLCLLSVKVSLLFVSFFVFSSFVQWPTNDQQSGRIRQSERRYKSCDDVSRISSCSREEREIGRLVE